MSVLDLCGAQLDSRAWKNVNPSKIEKQREKERER